MSAIAPPGGPVVEASVEYTLIKPHLTEEQMKPWYDKLVPFKFWVPSYMNCAGSIVIWDTPESEGTTYGDFYEGKGAWIALCGARKFLGSPKERLLQVKRPCSTAEGYLYSSTQRKPVTELEQAFVKSEDGFEKRDFYGLHTYGGYYGFFRPDIVEVIHLLHGSDIPVQEMEALFVTTDVHPSDDIGECFDNKANRHRAKTTVFFKRTAAAAIKQE